MKKIFNMIALSAMVLVTSSCLKSKDLIGPDAPNSIGAIIEFANPTYIAASTGTLTVPTARYEFTLGKTAAGDKVHIDVQYVGTNKPTPNDVTVAITTDAAALSTHKTQAGRTAYLDLPTTLYTLPTSVTIPAGTYLTGFDIPVKSDQFEAGKTYAVALKIASASSGTISGNFGTIILALTRTP